MMVRDCLICFVDSVGIHVCLCADVEGFVRMLN